MRKTGLILLWIGFVWAAWGTIGSHPIERSIIYSHYDRIPKTSVTFSREDIQREIRESTSEAMAHCRRLIFPSVMMLLGGLLLGAEPMKRNKGRDDANI